MREIGKKALAVVVLTIAASATGCGGFGEGAKFVAGGSVVPPGTTKTPAKIGLTSGDAQQGLVATPLANPLVVTVTDAQGAPVPGVNVTFAVGSGGGSLSSTAVATDALGEAKTVLTLGANPGTNTVTATATGANSSLLSGAPVTFTATGSQTAPPPPPPPPALSYVNDAAPILAAKCTSCHKAGGQAASAPLDTYSSVTQGTTKFGYAPAAYVAAGQPAASLVIVKVTGTLAGPLMPPVGSPALTATETKTLSDWIAQGAAYGPATPANVAKTSGDAQTVVAGGSLGQPLVVTVTDGAGRAVSNVPVTFAVASGVAVLSPSNASTDANGRAQTSVSQLGMGSNAITATVSGLSPVTFTATGVSATAKILSIVSGNGQTGIVSSKLAAPFVVKTADGTGKAIPGVTVTFAVTTGGGTLSQTSVASDANGLAKTVLTLGATVGTNTVTASAAGFTGSPATFTAKAASATQKVISIVSGNGQTGPVSKALANPLVVKAADGTGKAIAGASVTFAVVSGGGSLSATTVTTDAMGLAKTTLTLGTTAGANSVRATATGFTNSPLTFTATGTTTTTRTYLADVEPILKANCTNCHGPGGSQAARPLTTYTEVTTAKSSSYVPADYVKAGSSAASLLFLKMNGSSGVGGVMPPSGKLSAAQVQVVKDWIDTGASLGAGAPVAMAKVSGDNQSGPAGTMLPKKLVVVVKDASGSPVPAQTVTFAVTAGGGAVTPRTAVTDNMGQASTSLTLGPVPTMNTVKATLGTLTASFTAMGLASTYSGEPLKSSTNPLDQAALVALKAANVEPNALSTDQVFLRRVTADLAGRLPTESELTTFVADRSPSKRAATIDALLASSDFSTHWSKDILAPWACIETSTAAVQQWNAAVKTHLDKDEPLTTIVKNLITGSGDEGTIFDTIYRNYGATVRADRIMETFAGSSMQCGRCHDHKLTVSGQDDPLWTQDDVYSVYAYFALNANSATKVNVSGQRFGKPLDPKWVGDGYSKAVTPSGLTIASPLATRRQAFADTFAASNAFARGTAHRIFSEVMDPLLDPNQFLAVNVNGVKQPALLQALTSEFKKAGFSLKKFLRVILNSKLYQLSSDGTTTMHDELLARRTVRRHHGEVIAMGVTQVAGVTYTATAFVEAQFGYPSRRDTIGERTDQVNLGQALIQNNSPLGTSGKVTMNGSAITALANRVTAGTVTLDQAIQTIFRTALAREATAAELTAIKGQIAGVPVLTALQDVAVAVCATSEFVTR